MERNSTGPPPGEYARHGVDRRQRRQTPVSITSLPPDTMCRRASNKEKLKKQLAQNKWSGW